MEKPGGVERSGSLHLVMDTIDRLPHTGAKGIYLKRQSRTKIVERKQCIDKHGHNMPEVRNWKRNAKSDYELGVPEFDRLVRLHVRLRVPFVVTGCHGRTAGAHT